MLKTKSKVSSSLHAVAASIHATNHTNYHARDPESETLLKSSGSSSSLSSVASNGSSSKPNDYISFRRRAKIKQQERYGRLRLVALVLGILFIIFLSFVTNTRQYQPQISVIIPNDDLNLPGPTVPHGYLIYGPECKIPDIDPLAKDVMKIFHRETYKPCNSKPALTYIQQIWSNDTVFLHLNFSSVKSYVTGKNDYLECCYQEIIRSGEFTHADDKINLTSCHSFDMVVQLPAQAEFLLVNCKRISSKKKPETVYTNAHALVRRKPEVMKRFAEKSEKNATKPLSVLLIGIDSISRLNLIRAMPNTAQYLYDTGWMELKGYNKIDDNTFPNLMAILAGFNNSVAYDVCNPKKVGKLDACPMIWNNFREQGYATAYAEDETRINTFNYNKYGFLTPPVDHYLRPFGIAAEKHLHKTKLSSLTLCLGYQNYADYIYQYALDFAQQYKGHPYFGLFWTNTFSHNDISSASCMDDKMREYIIELGRSGILNETLVVFFSDHGMRFGNVRQLLTGWFEERLPFIFFSLPEWFKKSYPELVQNFKINRNRLTTPYDFHVTLKHILSLSSPSDKTPNVTLGGAPSCPACQSLFDEVPYNRSCSDAQITQHWCTCIPYEKSDKSSPEVKDAVKFAIQVINNELEAYKKANSRTTHITTTTTISGNNATAAPFYSNKCSKLKLKKISNAKIAKIPSDNVTYYLVVFEVYPGGGEFEATVKYNVKTSHQLTGSISRLNAYGNQGYCVNDDNLKKYCYCKD
ncbi:uncharacterized protein LOC134830271 [Culicoides brevitarsis]|uniref:uncharacterized protein LOC134830271 n=1 Tax=Culicoides brevitarsis TaxID=469753 RepID=UPI00307BEF25